MTERVYVFRVQRGGRLFWQRGGGLLAAPRRRPPALREDPPGLSGIRRAFTMACICRGALASQKNEFLLAVSAGFSLYLVFMFTGWLFRKRFSCA